MGLAHEARRLLEAPPLHQTEAGRTCWPREYYPLLDRYGVDTVWRVGLETLGFPPTWNHAVKEFDKLDVALTQLHPQE